MRSMLRHLIRHPLCVAALGAGVIAAPAMAGTYTVLHQFTGGADGANPISGVVLDTAGNIYGTTQQGGDTADSRYGLGVIYKIDPAGRFTTLFAFPGGDRGGTDMTGLTLAGQTLYGGANQGTNNLGMLFAVNTDGSDYTILHEFTGQDGAIPSGTLLAGSGGNLYGITAEGGPDYSPTMPAQSSGVLFRVLANGTYQQLHNFARPEGKDPSAIVLDSAGNIFGSTLQGGNGCSTGSGCGIIYEFTPATSVFKILYQFTDGADGQGPRIGSIGTDGTIYGMAGGTFINEYGTLFALTRSGSNYTLTTLAAFDAVSGGVGESSPTLAANGALVVNTSFALYGFENGSLTLLQHLNTAATGYEAFGQPAIGVGPTIYGTTVDGGVTPCNALYSSCGLVYSYRVR